MTILHLSNILMVLAGAVIMAIAIRTGLQVNKSVPTDFRPRWRIISLLMLFFLFGYCGFITLQLLRLEQYLELITSVVFLGGALFVLLIMNLCRQTITQLLTGENIIKRANAELVQKKEQLEQEIVKQAQAEHELREAKTTLEYIFNSAIPICITNLDYEIIDANTAYNEMFIGSHNRQGTLKCYDSRPGSSCQTAECPIRRIRSGEKEVVVECSKVDEDGKVYYFIVTARPFRNAAGELIGIIESFQDISPRKSAESQLALEKERLAITLQSIGDGVITTDLNGNILMINRVAESLCAYPSKDAIGQPLEEVYHVVDFTTRKPIDNPVQRVISSGKAVNVTPGAVLIAQDGWERFIADSAAPIRELKGNLFGVVLVFRDISEKRMLESEIGKLEKLKAIGQLAGGIAHDFNNLLAAILGNISLAKVYVDSASKVHEKLDRAENAIMKAKGLTQQLLTFSKGGAPVKKIMNLETVLRETVEFSLRGSNILYQFSINDNLWPVMADIDQVSQVINNLVINADQAMPEGGTISVAADNFIHNGNGESNLSLDPGKYVQVTISDNGCGIPVDHLPFIFDPYFTSKKTGSGLGLSTVFSIIRRHGGAITVDSEEGEGTTFSFYLPATEKEQEEVIEESREIRRGQGRILIMDDEPDILETASQMLTELGYTPTLVENGKEAIAVYQTAMQEGNPFSCVILDLTIPGGTGGRETVLELIGIDKDVKAIVSSGYSSDPVVANFQDFGFKAVIEKPYRLDELSNILHHVLKANGMLKREVGV